MIFSTSAQLPSSAEVRSSRGVSGQLSGPGRSFGVFQDVGRLVLQLLKNSCHSASTEAGPSRSGVDIVNVGALVPWRNEERANAAFASWRDMIASW